MDEESGVMAIPANPGAGLRFAARNQSSGAKVDPGRDRLLPPLFEHAAGERRRKIAAAVVRTTGAKKPLSQVLRRRNLTSIQGRGKRLGQALALESASDSRSSEERRPSRRHHCEWPCNCADKTKVFPVLKSGISILFRQSLRLCERARSPVQNSLYSPDYQGFPLRETP